MELVYGPAAAHEYRELGAPRAAATIARPDVGCLAIMRGANARAIVMFIVHENVGQIFFLHVLRGFEFGNPHVPLLAETVKILRAQNVEGIVCETLIVHPGDPCSSLESLGFEKFERAIMRGPLDAPGLTIGPNAQRTRAIDPTEFPAAAACLADAYEGDPGTNLHREMATAGGALRLVESIANGTFGAFRPQYARCVEQGGRMVSVLFGCEAVAKTGFIVQVATRPEFRGRGYAKTLLQDCAQEFRSAGMDRIALGVTLSNPARRLYERLGLTVRKSVDAYIWRRRP